MPVSWWMTSTYTNRLDNVLRGELAHHHRGSSADLMRRSHPSRMDIESVLPKTELQREPPCLGPDSTQYYYWVTFFRTFGVTDATSIRVVHQNLEVVPKATPRWFWLSCPRSQDSMCGPGCWYRNDALPGILRQKSLITASSSKLYVCRVSRAHAQRFLYNNNKLYMSALWTQPLKFYLVKDIAQKN